jgi:hypothetical protein
MKRRIRRILSLAVVLVLGDVPDSSHLKCWELQSHDLHVFINSDISLSV